MSLRDCLRRLRHILFGGTDKAHPTDSTLQRHPAHEFLSAAELFLQIPPENRYNEVRICPEVGREVVEW